MAVPLSEVGRRGRLNLIFSSRRGRTVIRDAYCEIPFKITRLHDWNSDGEADNFRVNSSERNPNSAATSARPTTPS